MLKSYTLFLSVFLLNNSMVLAQQNDTLKINLNHSNILIVNEREESNEWDFDKELNQIKKTNHKKKVSVYSIGLSLFSNSPKPWAPKYNNRIPYEEVGTNNVGYNLYKNLFKFLNNHGELLAGIGIQSHNISLGDNTTSINNNKLQFANDSLFSPSKNKLRCTYIQVPLLISIKPLLLSKPRFRIQLGTSFALRVKSILITKEFEGRNWSKTKTKGDFMLNQYYFNYHVNIIFKNIGVFSQFSTSSIFSDNANDYLFSTGVVISPFK
jgi:hypothetical protein